NAALAAVVEADYTVESWEAYQLVVAANGVTVENSQAEVDAATLAITTAQADLVEVPVEADLTAYNAALAAVVEADYTVESWEAYQLVVAANGVTVANSQAEVDAATVAIIAAQADLVGQPSEDEVAKAKAGFIAYLTEEVGKIDVAEVVIAEENITATFKADANPGDVLTAANGLINTIKDETSKGTLTLKVGEREVGNFNLEEGDVAVQIAEYLLDGTTPTDFIEKKQTIVADYTAAIADEYGVEFDLAGEVTFTVVKPTAEEAKAGFIAYLTEEVGKIDVADVVIAEEDITATFKADANPGDVLTAANGLINTIKDETSKGTLTLKVGEREAGNFNLEDGNVAVQIAEYLLDGTTPTDFIEKRQTITADYTAAITDKYGVKFGLDGELTFTVVKPTEAEAKADFLTYLGSEVEKIEVAKVVIDGENITTTFKDDADPGDVLTAATSLINAIKDEVSAGTLTLKVGEREAGNFNLEDGNVAVQIAEYLLDGTSPTDFIAKKQTIVAAYTAAITDEFGVEFDLGGDVTFTVVKPTPEGAKVAFLGYLEAKVTEIEVAKVVIDGENITTTFKDDADPGDVLTAATSLINAIKDEVSAGTLTLKVGEREAGNFNLEDGNVAVQIAEYLLNGTSPTDFIAKKQTIVAAYTAAITDEFGVEFDLGGDVTFTVVKPTAEEVIGLINELPTADELTVNNRLAVEAAREAYNFLTEEQQNLVTNIEKLISAEEKLEELIEAEITTAITDRIKPGFIGFANTINNQAPNSNPPYKLVVEYNIDGIEATFLFSDEAQKMDPWNGLKGTGLKTAFYSLVNVPEIQGASAGGNDVKFKDEDGNPKSGSGFELDLMLFGGYLLGDIPTTVGEIIGTQQIMNLDCKTASGVEFPMEITFFFKEANKYTVTFVDYNDTELKTERVEHGSAATAPTDPVREGYTFTGWNVVFTNVTEDLTVTATYNADQDAPTELAGVAPTSAEDNDGKITGTTTDMEYRLQGEEDWTEATGAEITGLAAGTYEVRYAAKEGYNAGTAADVIVAEYVAPASTDASITGITVKDISATVDGSDATIYNVELVAGTVLSELVAGDVEVTVTDNKATAATATTSDGGATWTVVVTAEDGTAETYTINVSVALDPDQGAANEVIGLINGLPAVEDLTLDNKEDVVAAKVAYEELSKEQKALISSETVEKLDAVFKQVFLEELDAKVAEKILPEVALYTRDGDSLTVEFVTTDGNLLLPAAQGLAIALMDVAYGSTLRIGETPFVLNETINAGGLAGALFNAGALGGNPVPYSADIIYNNIEGIILGGELTFKLPSDD
ncbi:InlB B-repeat-containing protein, partial [Peptoniphilus stercorisuis]